MAKLHKDWQPIDLTAVRSTRADGTGRYRNRVYRIGLELEGGWNKLPAGVHLVRDGSVTFSEHIPHVGELVSPILSITNNSPSWWRNWIRIHYPHHVNATCGMHVHINFKTAFSYNRVMTAAYPATVVEEFRKWATAKHMPDSHPIWPRLAGKCRFCQHVFDADNQARSEDKDHDQQRVGHRYTVINYCYGRYCTAECRLLPMMNTVDMATEAIQELLDITNAFLVALPFKREKKQQLDFTADEGLERVRTQLFV